MRVKRKESGGEGEGQRKTESKRGGKIVKEYALEGINIVWGNEN